MIESTDRRKKGKEKEPRLFTKAQRAEEESHREARGDCLGRTRGRMGKGSGAAAGLVGLEGWGYCPEVWLYLYDQEEGNCKKGIMLDAKRTELKI